MWVGVRMLCLIGVLVWRGGVFLLILLGVLGLEWCHGEGFAVAGDTYIDYERLPFGVFPLDLALGGGIPQGKLSMVFGPESSGKTVLCLLLVATFQKTHPHLAVVWVDAEWAWDPVWAAKLGVDVTKVTVLKPDFGDLGQLS